MTPSSMRLTAYCRQCARRHPIDLNPLVPDGQIADWYAKHAGHEGVGYDWPGRTSKPAWVDVLRGLWRVLDVRRVWRRVRGALVPASLIAVAPGPAFDPGQFGSRAVPHAVARLLENGNVTTEYAASAALTCGLHSTPLASSTTIVAGRESTAVSNTTNKYLDYLFGGKITTGTSPTNVRSIYVFLYGSIDDTPTYPDVLDGTDSDETFTSTDLRNASVIQFASTTTDNTSNRTYWFAPGCISPAFGWVVPKNWGVWVSHDTGVALNSTSTNHVLSYTGVYAAVA